jgi:hypothetical protein
MHNNTLNIGDEVTHVLWTDAAAGWVKSVSKSGKTVTVELAEQTLLNGVNSGEPDALKFAPGGFCGHTSGSQRWKIERADKPSTMKFTLRNTGQWKAANSSTKSPGNVLCKGHKPYYDFNF